MKKYTEQYSKSMTIPITHRMWEALRKMSIQEETSLNDLVRLAVKKMLAEKKG